MSDQFVRDGAGKILYKVQTHMGVTRVYDAHNVLLGWCMDGQTRNANGMLIAQREAPGLLVAIN